MMEPRSYAHAPRLPDGETVALDAVLPGTSPLLLEIGSGRGMFTLMRASLVPEQRLLALEVRRKYATLLDERLAAKKLTNARCFAEDARAALVRMQPAASVASAAIHFPDPWWKKRHAKRLVIGDVLVVELARLVAPGGFVFVQTDVEARADEYVAHFATSSAFRSEINGDDRRTAESPYAPARSNREARAIADGLPIWRMVFRRV